MNLYIYGGLLALGALLGFGSAWQIQTWRMDAERLVQAKKDNDVAQDIIKQQQQRTDDYLHKVEDNQKQAKELLQKQMDLQAQAISQNAVVQNQIESIKNVAKNLAPTHIKLDAAHQQLLESISETANSANTRSTKTTTSATSTQ